MKIKRLKLRNYCQHKDLTINFEEGSGLIGFFGQNGAGKSNAVGAIATGISGVFSRKKERLITLGEKSGHIELDVEIEPGKVYQIVRHLDTSDASVVADGVSITGSDAVTQFLLDKLSVDQGVLSNIVFVKQPEISEILFAKKERDRMASKFFGLDRAVSIEKDLSSIINSIQLYPISSKSSDVSQKIRSLKADRDALYDTLVSVSEEDKAELKLLSEQIAHYFSVSKSQEAWLSYEKQKAELTTEIGKIESSIAELANSISSVDIVSLRNLYIQEKEKRRISEERRSLSAQLDKFHMEQSNLKPSKYSAEDIEKTRSELSSLSNLDAVNASVHTARKGLLSQIQESGSASCSVCESSLCSADEHRIHSLITQAELQKTRSENLKQLTALLKTQEDELQKHNQITFSIQKRLDEISEGLANLGDDLGHGNPEKWDAHIASYDEMRDNKSRAESDIQTKRIKLEHLKEPDEIKSSLPPHFDPKAATDRCTAIRSLIDSSQESSRKIELRTKEIETLGSIEDETKKIELENTIQSELKVKLAEIRSHFHPDGAPKDLVSKRLKIMEHKINEYLEVLGSDFSVKGESGFNFVAMFHDKPGEIMASELSGGQMVALSVAFRIAAITSFSASVGLMSMDEPTQALDSGKIENFKLILDRLKEMSTRLGFQFLVITHEESLKECFDQIIDLSEAKDNTQNG